MTTAQDWFLFYHPTKKAFVGKYRTFDTEKQRTIWQPKCVPVAITDEHAAKAWFGQWHGQWKEKNVLPLNEHVHTVKTIRGLAPQWIIYKQAQPNHERCRHNCQKFLDRYVLNQPIADVPLEKMGLKDATTWVEWVTNSAISCKTSRLLAPYTRRNVVQGLREMFTDIRGKGWANMQINPLKDEFIQRLLKGAAPLAGKDTIIHLSPDEVKTLLSCKLVPKARHVLYLLAITTGLREGEIFGLCWDDIDFKGARIKVFRQLGQDGEFYPPKKDSNRWLPMHPRLIAELKKFKPKTAKYDEPVFPYRGGFQRPNAAKWLRKDLLLAGLSDKFDGHNFVFHSLRKTNLTMLEDAGVPQNHRDYLAGHRAKGVGDRHYVAKNIQTFRADVERLAV